MGSEYRDDQVRIHFHLRNEVMVGKKKTKDVQFVSQVRSLYRSSSALWKGTHSTHA